jgi:hypothetical protein
MGPSLLNQNERTWSGFRKDIHRGLGEEEAGYPLECSFYAFWRINVFNRGNSLLIYPADPAHIDSLFLVILDSIERSILSI